MCMPAPGRLPAGTGSYKTRLAFELFRPRSTPSPDLAQSTYTRKSAAEAFVVVNAATNIVVKI